MTDNSTSVHMETIQDTDLHSEHYCLPPHGFFKESSSTTNLQTVFDTSAKTSNGFSMNNILLTGKKVTKQHLLSSTYFSLTQCSFFFLWYSPG